MIDPTTMPLPKPAHGAPCNRCGRCCADELCPLGRHVFRRMLGPCPALSFDPTGASSCGLVDRPGAFSPTRAAMRGVATLSRAAATLIGASVGCDAQLADEPADEDFRRKLIEVRGRTAFEIHDAKRLWGVL